MRTCGDNGIHEAGIHKLLGSIEICNLVACKGFCLLNLGRIDIRYCSQNRVVDLSGKKRRGMLVPHVSETDQSYSNFVSHLQSSAWFQEP